VPYIFSHSFAISPCWYSAYHFENDEKRRKASGLRSFFFSGFEWSTSLVQGETKTKVARVALRSEYHDDRSKEISCGGQQQQKKTKRGRVSSTPRKGQRNNHRSQRLKPQKETLPVEVVVYCPQHTAILQSSRERKERLDELVGYDQSAVVRKKKQQKQSGEIERGTTKKNREKPMC